MKKILYIVLLSIIVPLNISAYSIYDRYKRVKKGDLTYDIYYTDSLKQEVTSFNVLYRPDKPAKFYKGKEYIDWGHGIKTDAIREINLVTEIENLAIKCFGEDKVLNKKGGSNINKVVFSTHILTGETHLRYIDFKKGAYNLVTDAEILDFIKNFNNDIKFHVKNKEEFKDDAILLYTHINVFDKNIETFIKGDLHYKIGYTDSLKQEMEYFGAWYIPEEYKSLFKGDLIEKDISMSNLDRANAEAAIENLAIKHFGEDKIFEKNGGSNIYNIIFKIDALSNKVYITNIIFRKEAYNLITDKEIKNFIEDFNLIEIKINNIERYGKGAFLLCNFIPFDK